MSPSDAQVRDIILGIFERVRQRPATPYDAERFLAYLTHPPSNSRRVADTFAGRRRLVRFIHAVQLDLGICFTLDEWERGFSVDAFVELVSTKMARPAQGLRLAKQRLQAARVGQASDPLKLGLPTSPFLVGAVVPTPSPLRILAALLWVTTMGGAIVVGIRDVRYCRELVARIEQVAANSRPEESWLDRQRMASAWVLTVTIAAREYVGVHQIWVDKRTGVARRIVTGRSEGRYVPVRRGPRG